jgi:hypothetical protein
MKRDTLADTTYFTLESFNNGWAYLLFNKSNKGTIWLQDSEATTFRNELESLENISNMTVERALSEMWFQYYNVADIPFTVN